jgi:hypothetical protein
MQNAQMQISKCEEQINLLQSQTNNKLEIILQLVQQNTRNIEKGTNSKQMAGNSQIPQIPQDTQISQRSTQKLTYAQKAAQSAGANANANANAGEWNLITKKPSSKSQEMSYRERRLIVTFRNEN